MHQALRTRIRPNWQPQWTTEVEGWTAKQVKLNLWRFDKAEDFDDVMQDARLLYFILQRKYPAVNEARHYFALYRTSLFRMFIDKTRKLQRSVIDQNVAVDEVPMEMSLPSTSNYGYFNLLLEEMPDELKLVLGALTSGRVRLKLDKPTKTLRHRENHNMRLKRQLPLSSKDPVGDLRCYFANS